MTYDFGWTIPFDAQYAAPKPLIPLHRRRECLALSCPLLVVLLVLATLNDQSTSPSDAEQDQRDGDMGWG